MLVASLVTYFFETDFLLFLSPLSPLSPLFLCTIRYAVSALYALASKQTNRNALLSTDSIGRGLVLKRTKTLLQKNILTKKNKIFCHEIKHFILRLENEINEIPMVTSNGKGAVDVDEDWFSDSEDFLDDPKYTSAGLGAGG